MTAREMVVGDNLAFVELHIGLLTEDELNFISHLRSVDANNMNQVDYNKLHNLVCEINNACTVRVTKKKKYIFTGQLKMGR